MFGTETLLGLGGVILLVATTVMWFVRAYRVAIPDNRTMFLLGWVGAGVLGAASLVGPDAGWGSYIVGGLATLGSVFYLVIYALQWQNAPNSISVGDIVPAFDAVDDQGRTYSSDALIGTPTLFKFFRGHW